jgi:transcriptional regulator with XRE-family HTH domain
MASRLGHVARRRRRLAGLRMIDIAHAAGVSESTISNFELGIRWVQQTDEIVAAYAQLCGTSDAALWIAAAELDDDPPREQ